LRGERQHFSPKNHNTLIIVDDIENQKAAILKQNYFSHMNFLNYEIILQVISSLQNRYLLPEFQLQAMKWTGDSVSKPAKTSLMY
jgi:hypothetical protein